MRALLAALLLAGAPAPKAKVLLEPDPGPFKRLQPRQVTASSFLKNGWNAYEQNYLPLYAVDDDPATAWVEGAPGLGAGESLVWLGPRLKKARAYRLFFRSGYQKSQVLFDANARPRKLRLEPIKPGEVAPVAAGKPLEVELESKVGWQQVDLPTEADVAGVRITLLSAYKGGKYEDTCLSDLRVYVDGEDPYQPAAEAAAAEEVRKFVLARKQAAAQPARPGPRLAAKYKGGSSGLGDGEACAGCEHNAGALLDAVLAGGSSTEKARLKAAVVRARAAAALWDAPRDDKAWRAFDPAGASAAEAQLRAALPYSAHGDGLARLAPYLAAPAPGEPEPEPEPEDGTPSSWHQPPSFRVRGPNGALRALEMEWTTLVGERDLHPVRLHAVVVYEQGLASALVVQGEDREETAGLRVYSLEWQPGVDGPTLAAISEFEYRPAYTPDGNPEDETPPEEVPARLEFSRYEGA